LALSAEVNGEGGGRHGRARLAGLVIAAAMLFALAAAGSASAAEPWGFEQVSPVDKGAGAVSGINTFTAAPDGESFLYSAYGSFNEVPSKSIPMYTRYLAERGEDKWINRPNDPPFAVRGSGVFLQFAIMVTQRTSENLKYSFVSSLRALTPGATEGGSNHYIQDNLTGELTLVMTSPDFRETDVLTGLQGQVSVYWVAQDGKAALFHRTYAEGSNPKGLYKWTAEDGLEYAGGYEWEGTTYSLSSTNNNESGARERFPVEDALTNLYLSSGFTLNSPVATPVVLRRESGDTPISVSHRPENEGTAVKGYLQTVSEGGEFATFFTKADRLTEDSPAGGKYFLYRYDESEDDLDYIAYSNGGNYDFRVLQASRDGQTVAFTSQAALAPGATEAPSSQTNVYVWRNGSTQFVYRAAAVGPKMFVLSLNGRYLYFTDGSTDLATSFGTETVSLACADSKAPATPLACEQAYLYDAGVSGGNLDCLSCAGGVAKGNGGDPSSNNSATLAFNGRQSWNVTNDGRAFFATAEALLPADTNGLEDVYEFHEGGYRLVSPAKAGYSYRFIDASRDGSAIFLTTTDAIVPQDQDTVTDLYVTREGAGFPYNPPPVTPPCLGAEACHGSPSAAPNTPGASTAAFKGNPNPPIVTGKVSLGKATTKGARLTVRVRVSGPGKLRLSGKKLKGLVRTVRKAGAYKLTVALSGRARKTLAAKGKVRVNLGVRFSPEEGRGANVSKAYVFKSGRGGS
jgi:hypothetical protein